MVNLRRNLNRPLTWEEMDDNFIDLDSRIDSLRETSSRYAFETLADAQAFWDGLTPEERAPLDNVSFVVVGEGEYLWGTWESLFTFSEEDKQAIYDELQSLQDTTARYAFDTLQEAQDKWASFTQEEKDELDGKTFVVKDEKAEYKWDSTASGGTDFFRALPTDIEEFTTTGKNKANKETFREYRWMDDGRWVSYPGFLSTPSYTVIPGQVWTISGHRSNSNYISRVIFLDQSGAVLPNEIIYGNDTTTTTFTVPAGAANMGINISDSLGGGTPTDNEWSNAFQLELNDEATPYEPYSEGIKAEKIIGDLPYVKEDLFVPLQETVEDWKVESSNMVDPSKIENRYFQTSGKSVSSDNWICVSLKVEPNTTYTIKGVDTTFLGNEYSDEPLWDYNLIQAIPLPGTGGTFTTSPTTQWIGINISNVLAEHDEKIDSVMVNEGEEIPYEPFGSIFINPEKIKGNVPAPIETESLPGLFLRYEPTGYGGNELVTFFVRKANSNIYIAHKVGHEIDTDEVVYTNQYRLVGADEYTYSNGQMTLNFENVIIPSESESVYRNQNNKVDFTGGYHGDEQFQEFKVFLDGNPVDLSGAINLLPGESAFYIQKSTTHETADETTGVIPGHPVEAIHYKKTFFGNSGYETYNDYVWEKAINVFWYHGICCMGAAYAQYVMDEYFDIYEVTGSNANFINKTNHKFVSYWHPDNNRAAEITSTIISDSVDDSDCENFVKDRGYDAKYYRKTPDFTTVIGQRDRSIMKVTYK